MSFIEGWTGSIAGVGLRYYANDALTGGHLLTMIANAKKIAGYMSSEQTMKAHYPAMYRIMELELAHRETLRGRERFLNDHIDRLLRDTFNDKHQAMLPAFVRAPAEDPPQLTNGRGEPIKQTNLGLLDRYDEQDLRAIYLGLGQYQKDGVGYEQVIEPCEKDWFIFGVHAKRIENRVSIMKVLHTNWDMALVNGTFAKRTSARRRTARCRRRRWPRSPSTTCTRRCCTNWASTTNA